MTNLNYMYAVICESDNGMDVFGNPIGKPILLESIGDDMSKSKAIERARKYNHSKMFGRAKVVRLEVCNYEVGEDQ